MILRYQLKDEDKLIALEEEIYENYNKLIKKYEEGRSCHINVARCWTVDGNTIIKHRHPKVFSKYVYYICYRICNEKNIPIVYDSENSFLEKSYATLVVKKRKNRLSNHMLLVASFIDDMDDVSAELLDDLNRLRAITNQTNQETVRNH